MKNGSRYSSNKAYLHPVKARPNLFLTRKSRADKVLIDRWSKQAYGVLFTKHSRRIRVRARKEVILCAGAIGSPQLLMLSGIGPASHIQEFNIPVIKSLPVGQNLMDHLSYWGLNFLVNDSVTVVTEELFELTNTAITDYLGRQEGPLTIAGGIEAAAGFLDVDDRSARQG
ncbi:hypothetical protein TSAR_009451 [Trichomalopsis sarcophagae]|uniref:Glucose-methanol-choline oxidoreductase N-terminal domain-containing protein n=1 Tax=Trichomalopsis sarcophagae TaxID=543379 RepID=A0A232FF20_9HYME|nr:hypothetical protein TSAR_009451 [Trichomalopsis sarcophagae]